MGWPAPISTASLGREASLILGLRAQKHTSAGSSHTLQAAFIMNKDAIMVSSYLLLCSLSPLSGTGMGKRDVTYRVHRDPKRGRLQS